MTDFIYKNSASLMRKFKFSLFNKYCELWYKSQKIKFFITNSQIFNLIRIVEKDKESAEPPIGFLQTNSRIELKTATHEYFSELLISKVVVVNDFSSIPQIKFQIYCQNKPVKIYLQFWLLDILKNRLFVKKSVVHNICRLYHMFICCVYKAKILKNEVESTPITDQTEFYKHFILKTSRQYCWLNVGFGGLLGDIASTKFTSYQLWI